MNICFTASRLMKVSEVRRLCKEMRENQALLQVTELKAKEELYKRFWRKKRLVRNSTAEKTSPMIIYHIYPLDTRTGLVPVVMARSKQGAIPLTHHVCSWP